MNAFKMGDIIENESAGDVNPNKRMMYLRSDKYNIYCLGVDGMELRFYRTDQIRDGFLKVVGSIDLSGLGNK